MRIIKIAILLLITCVSSTVSAQSIRNDFEKYFKEKNIWGSFTVYDLKKNQYTYYNQKDFIVATSPASTFKIPNSLIALELGVVKDENEVVKWDGIKRWNADWNKDMDMKTAFKVSNVGFYQEMARRIGAKNYQKYLKLLNYGNQTSGVPHIFGKIDMFWLNNTLRISPKNQLEFLVKLYQDKLPFSKRTTDIVKKIMFTEQGENYKIYSKTGWYQMDSDPKNEWAWWVGYVEKAEDTYFFATRIYKDRQTKIENFGEIRKEITRKMLHDLGIL